MRSEIPWLLWASTLQDPSLSWPKNSSPHACVRREAGHMTLVLSGCTLITEAQIQVTKGTITLKPQLPPSKTSSSTSYATGATDLLSTA